MYKPNVIVFVPIMFRFEKHSSSFEHISFRLFAHNIHPVEVLVISLLGGHDCRGRDGGLSHHVVGNSPVEFFLLEVGHARLLDAVRDADVDAAR